MSRRRATSIRRTAEDAEELNMEGKEATPVEEVEVIVRDAQGDKLEPKRTTKEMKLDRIIEMLQQLEERRKEDKQEDRETLKQMRENNEEIGQ